MTKQTDPTKNCSAVLVGVALEIFEGSELAINIRPIIASKIEIPAAAAKIFGGVLKL